MLKKYLIERNISNVGKSSNDDYQKMVGTSNEVLGNLGPDIEWEESFVTDNKVYCVYKAANEEIIRKHAELGGIPADKISEIRETLSPRFGEEFTPQRDQRPDVDLNLA